MLDGLNPSKKLSPSVMHLPSDPPTHKDQTTLKVTTVVAAALGGALIGTGIIGLKLTTLSVLPIILASAAIGVSIVGVSYLIYKIAMKIFNLQKNASQQSLDFTASHQAHSQSFEPLDEADSAPSFKSPDNYLKWFSSVFICEDIANTEDLYFIENDGQSSSANIIDTLYEKSFDRKNLSMAQNVSHKYLTGGQVSSEHRKIECGKNEFPMAFVLRANPTSQKPIEDHLNVKQLTFEIKDPRMTSKFGLKMTTTLLVINDGHQKHNMTRFYSEKAPEVFQKFMQKTLNDSLRDPNEMSMEQMVKPTLLETHYNILSQWEQSEEFVKENDSNPTVTMVFLFPDSSNDSTLPNNFTKGVVFNMGNSRAILLSQNNPQGKILRLGSAHNSPQIGGFSPSPGDKLFVSSDGIWNNASPHDVSVFLEQRIEDLTHENEEMERSEILKEALLDLVDANAKGRPDDNNPLMVEFT